MFYMAKYYIKLTGKYSVINWELRTFSSSEFHLYFDYLKSAYWLAFIAHDTAISPVNDIFTVKMFLNWMLLYFSKELKDINLHSFDVPSQDFKF